MSLPVSVSTMSIITYLKKAMCENRMDKTLTREYTPDDTEQLEEIQKRYQAMDDAVEYYENYWGQFINKLAKMSFQEIDEYSGQLSGKKLLIEEVLADIEAEFTELRLKQVELYQGIVSATAKQLFAIQEELRDIDSTKKKLHLSEYELHTELEDIQTKLADIDAYFSCGLDNDGDYTDDLMS